MRMATLCTAAFLAAASFPTTSSAQNMAPELFLEGKDCEAILEWATQPAPVLKEELEEMLGTEMSFMLKGGMGKSVVNAARREAVSNQWFARKCDFTEAQLAEMAPLQEGYILYLESMRSE